MVNAHKQAQGWVLTAVHKLISCSRFSPSTASPRRSGLTKTSGYRVLTCSPLEYTLSTCSPSEDSSFGLMIPDDIFGLLAMSPRQCEVHNRKQSQEKRGKSGSYVFCYICAAIVHHHKLDAHSTLQWCVPVMRGLTGMRSAKKIRRRYWGPVRIFLWGPPSISTLWPNKS